MNVVDNTSTFSESIQGHKPDCVTEVVIPVPWGHISGKWWGAMDQQPIVALHGLQDNAGTFDALIPLLPSDTAILAIDLPGHGLSSHVLVGQYNYILWDGLVALRRVNNYFKWNKVKLLGHSLGGAITFLYAATYPDEVELLINLDIAGASIRDITKTPPETGDTIDKFLRYESLLSGNPISYTYEEAINIAYDGYKGSVTKDGIIALMKRGLQPTSDPNRFYFSRDPRLKAPGLAMMISLDLILAYAARIKCDYLNIRAVPGMKFEQPEVYTSTLNEIKAHVKKFEYHEVEGTHHVHLNNPERIAPIINKFIST